MMQLSKPASTLASDKFILRFDVEGLRKELKIRAATNERSLNSEILYLIKCGLEAEAKKEGVSA